MLKRYQVNILQSSAVTSRFMIFFNMSCLGMTLQVRGQDGMSTPQNDVAAYLQFHILEWVVSHCLPCGFRLPDYHSPTVDAP